MYVVHVPAAGAGAVPDDALFAQLAAGGANGVEDGRAADGGGVRG
jgi:hypothetical protein